MKLNVFRVVLPLLFLFLVVFSPRPAFARGHDGFYMGAGVLTMPMVTTEHRLTAPGGSSRRISFQPGIGGWLLVGYDFPNTMWGIQMPFEYQYFELNDQEWVHQMGSTLEGVMRLAQAANGFEFHLLFGMGWNYLTEGSIGNRSRCGGITGEFGPGISWFFARGDTRASLTIETPLRMIHYFGTHLSADGTTVFAFPIRLGLTVGF